MVDLDLIEQIYDIALGDSSWDEVMERLRILFGAEVSVLFTLDETILPVKYLSGAGADPSQWGEYAEYYAKIDPWAELFRSGAAPNNAMLAGERFLSYREFIATEYFNDWWRREAFHFTAGGHFSTVEGDLIHFSLPRSKAAGAYDDKDLYKLNIYARHIMRALVLQRAISERSQQPDFDAVAVAYGLSTAEARLLEILLQTGSLRKSAERLHKSYNTVRSQLRSIFLKTGTTSQLELMRLFLRGRNGGNEIWTP